MSGLTVGSLWPLISGLALGRFTFAQLKAEPRLDLLMAIILLMMGALLVAIHGLLRFVKLGEELRNWRFGMRGEQAVAEKLASRDLAAAGYVVFHDLPAQGKGKNWNVDHVVVGPGVCLCWRRKRARSQSRSGGRGKTR